LHIQIDVVQNMSTLSVIGFGWLKQPCQAGRIRQGSFC
jgi:hypothetical protein